MQTSKIDSRVSDTRFLNATLDFSNWTKVKPNLPGRTCVFSSSNADIASSRHTTQNLTKFGTLTIWAHHFLADAYQILADFC